VCFLPTGFKCCCCCVLLCSPHLQGVPAGSTPGLSAAQQPPSHTNCRASKQTSRVNVTTTSHTLKTILCLSVLGQEATASLVHVATSKLPETSQCCCYTVLAAAHHHQPRLDMTCTCSATLAPGNTLSFRPTSHTLDAPEPHRGTVRQLPGRCPQCVLGGIVLTYISQILSRQLQRVGL